jgi:hypothetical protein
MVRLEGDERVRAVAKLAESEDGDTNGNGADDESEE